MLLFVAMVVHHCLQVFKYAPRIATLTKRITGRSGNLAGTVAIQLATMVFTFEDQRRARPDRGAAWVGAGQKLDAIPGW